MAFQAICRAFLVNKKHSYSLRSAASSFVVGNGRMDFGRSLHSLPISNGILRQPTMISSVVFTRFAFGKKKRVDPPTDFLPFPWERSKVSNHIEKSGDHVRSLDVDPNLSKDGLCMTKHVEDLDACVRKQFTMETATKQDRREVGKELMLKRVQQHPMDFNSQEVKITLQTLKVLSLMEHFNSRPKVADAKVKLIHAIHRRNKMLRKLRDVNMACFEWLTKELNIDYTPSPLMTEPVRYTRKNELRRLTKEYCENLISDKRAAYHAQLKEQQEAFLKEKEEILAWIAEEEKDLGISQSNSSS